MHPPSHSCKHRSFLPSLCECVLDSAGSHIHSSQQHEHLKTWLPHDLAHQHHTPRPVHIKIWKDFWRFGNNYVMHYKWKHGLCGVTKNCAKMTSSIVLCNHCWLRFVLQQSAFSYKSNEHVQCTHTTGWYKILISMPLYTCRRQITWLINAVFTYLAWAYRLLAMRLIQFYEIPSIAILGCTGRRAI